MPRSRAAQDRHNERRRQSRGKARQAMFSMDYIQMKYPEIYNEAEGFFTVLNLRYPDKHDLRKTNEFLCFKHITEGKSSKDGKELYFDIKTASVSVRNIENPTVTSVHSQSQLVETMHSESLPFETVTSVQCESQLVETMHSESLPFETVTSVHSQSQLVEICHSESLPVETVTSVQCESPSTETTETISSVSKELEPRLEITLIPEQQARKATVTTQTLQITTEQESPPISFNDIPSDMIDEIISQLRQDPELTDIFNDTELQMEFDELGEDLDMPEMNLLEQELWW